MISFFNFPNANDCRLASVKKRKKKRWDWCQKISESRWISKHVKQKSTIQEEIHSFQCVFFTQVTHKLRNMSFLKFRVKLVCPKESKLKPTVRLQLNNKIQKNRSCKDFMPFHSPVFPCKLGTRSAANESGAARLRPWRPARGDECFDGTAAWTFKGKSQLIA